EMKQPVNQAKETKQENDGAAVVRKSSPAKAARVSRAKQAGGEQVEQELTSGTGEELFAEIDGRELRLTNLNKIYFPEDGITKRNLLAYYHRMAPLILPFLKDRPLVLRRYPNGIAGEAFFQKDADKNTPEWVKTAPIVSEGKGKKIHYFIANDRATLLYLTNLGCIDHNPWSSRAGSVENPDYIFFDLDPTDGTPFTTVVKVAKILMGILEKAEMAAFAKTSGATGIHIFLPVEPRYTYEQARTFVQAVSALVDAKHPGLLTFERSVAKRPAGRILIDAHQNSEGQSLASVYSVRAFPHAPVSTPVQTNELDSKLLPAKWNLKSLDRRLEKTGDLWANFWKRRQELEPAVKLLERMR
ncbi:MAG: non-homologous end-joining DNA ligase, partial [Candidatus Acidiferrales bacterium]